MFVYIINLLSVFVWYYLLNIIKLKNKTMLYTIIMTTQLFVFSALRDFSVGSDTHVYVRRFSIIANSEFNQLSNLTDVLDFEIGFIYLSKLISLISINPRFYLSVLNLLILIGVAIFIKQHSKIIWLSYFLFISFGFWGNSLNVVRQFLAVAILINSIGFVKDKKIVKFFAFVLIATSLHSAALTFIIVYPLSFLKVNIKSSIIFMGAIMFTSVFSETLINFIMINSGYDHLSGRLGSGSGSGTIVVIGTLLASVFYVKQVSISDYSIPDTFIHILFCGVVFNILALEFAMFGRMMIYFTIIIIVLIPNTIYCIRFKLIDFYWKYFVVLVFTYFYIFRLLAHDVSGLVPYAFFSNY